VVAVVVVVEMVRYHFLRRLVQVELVLKFLGFQQRLEGP
jgi:hypothetical protein